MASKYKVLTYGNPALRKKATPIKTVDAAIRKLAAEMLQVMYAVKGLGLAAQQIGRGEAICVIDVPPPAKAGGEEPSARPHGIAMPIVMINPRIDAMRGEEKRDEGCLSFPEIFVGIKRAEEVTVSFLSLDNAEKTISTTGLLARAVQHEMDHLNGVLIVDRMSPVQKIGIAGKLKRLKKSSGD